MNLTADHLALATTQQHLREAEEYRLTHPNDAARAVEPRRRPWRTRLHLPHLHLHGRAHHPQPLH